MFAGSRIFIPFFILLHGFACLSAEPGNVKYISNEKFSELKKNSSDFRLIDVRETWEYSRGHIKGAVHLPLGRLSEELETRIPELNKSDRIILYCHTSKRSAHGYSILKALGYNNVMALESGWIGWKKYLKTVEISGN